MASDPARPVFIIVQLSDSFAQVWATLAEAVGAIAIESSPSDICLLTENHSVAGIIVTGGGVEENLSQVVAEVRDTASAAELIAVGESTSHRLALAAVSAGAGNYIALPSELPALRSWIALRSQLAQDALARSTRVAGQRNRASFGRLVGESPVLRDVIERTERIIPILDLPILITGETGTGKELLAQAIHYQGTRADQPFVEVNCAALPAGLLESELFGAEKGAFTDAKTTKAGLFESAHGGTLFLDEIGDMSIDLQGKILKVIEDKRVRRVGGVHVKEVDVRVVAATHVNLRERVREGRFREDLFYRLSVIPLHLPPLRARGDDILLLAHHFLGIYSSRYKQPLPKMSAEFKTALLRHSWPGNVRELAHALNRAILLGGPVLGASVLEFDVHPQPTAMRDGDSVRLPWPCTMSEAESMVAAEALERSGGNKVRASEILDISRNRLRRLLGDGPIREADS